jgi:hypothetical protein
MKQYALVGKPTPSELVKAVTEMMKKGWKPQGGVLLTNGFTYMQAMVK